MDKLYIVIPAYNEEENIQQVIEDWYPIVEKYHGEGESRLVIIDDGSKDNTYQIMQNYATDRPLFLPLTKDNGGHGATVLYGYQYALKNHADYIFQTDSDVPDVLVGDFFNRRSIWSCHGIVQNAIWSRPLGSYGIGKGKCHPFCSVFKAVFDGNLHNSGVWWEIEVFSFCEKTCAEVRSVLCDVLIDRVLGISSLDHEGTSPRATAATAAKLLKQLMSTLIRAEILHSEQ